MAIERQYKGLQAGAIALADLGASLHGNLALSHSQAQAFGLRTAIAHCGEDTFVVMEWIFGVCFTVEIVLKFVAIGKRFFTDPWNALDTTIVLAWVLSVFEQFAYSKTARAQRSEQRLVMPCPSMSVGLRKWDRRRIRSLGCVACAVFACCWQPLVYSGAKLKSLL
eukprot:5182078-Amphidinium_carterae.1